MLAEYRIIDLVYEGSKTLVYRAQRLDDCQLVILKLLKSEYPTISELRQFRNQYAIANNLNFEGVVRFNSLEKYRNSLILIAEDFGGISLNKYVELYGITIIASNEPVYCQETTPQKNNALCLADFWQMALQTAEILEQLYRQGVIHKNINPEHILINPNTKQIKLTDFGLASVLSKNELWINCDRFEGTLAYISPEQTGRTNRGIDHRCDYYSLGVTFYQLLTGQLPFTTIKF
jgi:serine/threonine protein kinase